MATCVSAPTVIIQEIKIQGTTAHGIPYGLPVCIIPSLKFAEVLVIPKEFREIILRLIRNEHIRE
jgi:hypothetical protein